MTVYILTNFKRTVLYIGVTNDLGQRLVEHYLNRGKKSSFASRYHCYYLLYYKNHDSPIGAIEREKELKKWRREKKDQLIDSLNPERLFLNSDIISWPPEKGMKSR